MITWIVIGVIVVLILFVVVGGYNKLVALDQRAEPPRDEGVPVEGRHPATDHQVHEGTDLREGVAGRDLG